MAETYEKRARKKRKEQKRREKAQLKLSKDQEPGRVPSDEEIAARYLDVPDESHRR